IDLNEIELLALENFLNSRKRAGFVMRDPDVADVSLRLPFTQRSEMCVDIDKVVDLHQVDPFCLQPRPRAFHRVDPTLFTPCLNFGCEKKLLLNSKPCRAIADDLL